MPEGVRTYVRVVDATNRVVGLFAMYLVFLMMGVLVYSTVMKNFSIPPLWTLEMAQFIMVAYYLLGGGLSLQMGSHVRMDLVYDRWTPRGRAIADAITVLLLIFYLIMLIYGGYSSSIYAIEYGERSYSSWRPYMAPVKIVMTIGIIAMLFQAVAELFKDIARVRGEELQ